MEVLVVPKVEKENTERNRNVKFPSCRTSVEFVWGGACMCTDYKYDPEMTFFWFTLQEEVMGKRE